MINAVSYGHTSGTSQLTEEARYYPQYKWMGVPPSESRGQVSGGVWGFFGVMAFQAYRVNCEI